MPRTAARVWASASRAIFAMRSKAARASSRIRVDQRPSRTGLDGDGAEVVADDVVDVARDPHALARGRLARLGGAQLRQAAGLVADLREQPALLAQEVGEQQRDADDADVGDELERAQRLSRRIGGGERGQHVPDERERAEHDGAAAVGEIDGGRRDQQRREPSRRRRIAERGGAQRRRERRRGRARPEPDDTWRRAAS